MSNSDKDPIIAIATASGRGGIGILRLSFKKALALNFIEALFGSHVV